MKKTLEKFALIAHACISCVFVLLTVMILFNVLPLNFVNNSLVVDSIVLVLIVVLAIIYAGLTAYLLYCALNQNQLLKYVELYRDSTASVMATSKTVKSMVTENAKRVGDVKVNKIKISNASKYGLILKVWLEVSSDKVSFTLDTLRCLCEDSFNQVLGLRFSGIDFKIEKINGNYQPSVEEAQQQAKTLAAERKYVRECYQDPLCEKCDEQDGESTDEQPPQEADQPTQRRESDEQTAHPKDQTDE